MRKILFFFFIAKLVSFFFFHKENNYNQYLFLKKVISDRNETLSIPSWHSSASSLEGATVLYSLLRILMHVFILFLHAFILDFFFFFLISLLGWNSYVFLLSGYILKIEPTGFIDNRADVGWEGDELRIIPGYGPVEWNIMEAFLSVLHGKFAWADLE